MSLAHVTLRLPPSSSRKPPVRRREKNAALARTARCWFLRARAVWMLAAMTGDAGAYRQLLVSLTPHVRAAARSRCRRFGAPEGEVEDLVQEVLLTIHLKRRTWDPSRPIGPWVAAITRNKLIDVLRRRRHIAVPIEDLADSLQAKDLTPELSTRDIDTLLGRLKPHQREIVRSISLNGSSIRETADRLEMTEGAVRVTLHRALKALGAIYQSSARELTISSNYP
jgi:RNA polymerase sigma factor (sigma-70 family)